MAQIDVPNSGGIYIYASGLKEIIERNVKAVRMPFNTDEANCAAHATVQFIALGTPDTLMAALTCNIC